MNAQLLNDLHLEDNSDFVATPAPGADLLVLAGDIGSYQTRRDGSVMSEPDWCLQRFSPLSQYAATRSGAPIGSRVQQCTRR